MCARQKLQVKHVVDAAFNVVAAHLGVEDYIIGEEDYAVCYSAAADVKHLTSPMSNT